MREDTRQTKEQTNKRSHMDMQKRSPIDVACGDDTRDIEAPAKIGVPVKFAPQLGGQVGQPERDKSKSNRADIASRLVSPNLALPSVRSWVGIFPSCTKSTAACSAHVSPTFERQCIPVKIWPSVRTCRPNSSICLFRASMSWLDPNPTMSPRPLFSGVLDEPCHNEPHQIPPRHKQKRKMRNLASVEQRPPAKRIRSFGRSNNNRHEVFRFWLRKGSGQTTLSMNPETGTYVQETLWDRK